MREVIILGSTGSIGVQALAVIAANSDQYQVKALAAGGGQLELLARQTAEFRVDTVGIAQPDAAAQFADLWSEMYPSMPLPQILSGMDAIAEIAGSGSENTVVLNGITGSVGLAPTLCALESGATLALANKESLVAGGALVQAAMQRPGQIVPVDSEHSAIAQALRGGRHRRGLTVPEVDGTTEVAKIILTASGGPFRGKKRADLQHVDAKAALQHPTWKMGPVVTINSATLFNKALELIEAAYLFAVDPKDIIPVVHPQSIVHSLVQFQDGSTIAQASPPDMKLPIALGLSWPERLVEISAPCNWESMQTWEFFPLDVQTFPAIELARQALQASPLHPAVMNAANEECVSAFLVGKLSYLGIIETVADVLHEFADGGELALAMVKESESWARNRANEIIGAKL
ncbi:1-deoxy-D-xylulose-5-phosphate reductoisomerase [Arcanobacterium hippocoleae]|uniref:1-deoxy-D-xylulose-5-phosphate reductoisomerase n=1 Tax=Arcanobacterium hippocoleae TaxID=149017 RepID=UPI003340FAD0